MSRKPLTNVQIDQKRDRILKAALPLISKYGYEKTTIEEIAHDARLSVGATYLYFHGKSQIFTCLYEGAIIRLEKSFDAVLATPFSTTKERITVLLMDYVNYYKKNYDYYRIIASGFWSKNAEISNNPTISQYAINILNKLGNAVKEGVEKGEILPCDTFATAVSLWAMNDGVLMLQEKTHVSYLSEHFEEYYKRSIEIMLKGVFIN